MKLKNKFIPLMGLLTSGTVVVPLSLSGCGSNTAMNHSFNLVNQYRPTIKRYQPEMGHEKMTVHDINEEYMNQLNKNLDTFVQDYMWSKSWSGLSFEQFLFWQKLVEDVEYEQHIEFDDPVPKPKENVDRVVVGPVQDWYKKDVELISHLEYTPCCVNWNGVEWHVAILSFTLKFESDILPVRVSESEAAEQKVNGYVDGKVSGEITFYNVPFYVRARTFWSQSSDLVNQTKSVEPFYEWMSGADEETFDKPVPNWQIKTLVKSSIAGEIEFASGVVQRIANDWTINIAADNEHPEWKYGNLSLSETIGCIFSGSYFLEQVQIKEGE